MTTSSTFNGVYVKLIEELFVDGVKSVSRKGKRLTELYDKKFVVLDPEYCMAISRDMSYDYLKNEFAFYMSGSNKLEDAVKCSPFWKNCTDDGETINSNYGKLLFYDRNEKGSTQFEHALKCLENSKGSKKAVMTIYDKENAYISNDNPCTMFLRARIQDDQLHLTTVMRSSDIYYGLPYDVPFFIFVQHALLDHLIDIYPNLSIGTYTHIANSLHMYEYKEEELEKARIKGTTIGEHALAEKVWNGLLAEYLPVARSLCRRDGNFMDLAWKKAQLSKCWKKKVGCVFTSTEAGSERVVVTGYGDISDRRDRNLCESMIEGHVCRRDDLDDIWYETGCPSIHAEHRALNNLFMNRIVPDFSKVAVYVTHGPCDACLKMLDAVGVTKVFYDVGYKTDYSHWPNMEIKQLKSDLRPEGEKDKTR